MRTPKALLAWWGVLLIILGVGYAHGFLLPPGGRLNAHSGGAASIQRRLASTPTSSSRSGDRRLVRTASSPTPDKQPSPSSWPPKGFRPFQSLREEGSDFVDLSMEPHRDSLLDAAPSQFFSGFRLREKDEGDAAHMEGEQTIGISVRGFLWFIALLYPFMGLGFLCSAAAQFLVDEAGNPIGNLIKTDPDLKSIHGFVGTILGFTISIRTSSAYERYYEGRKILSSILDNSRAIIRDVYSFLLRPQAAATGPNVPDDEAVVAISDDLRRRLDILFAFIRQSVRESFLGFDPSSDFVNVPFTNQTFYLDPIQPQLLDLLTREEAERYAAMSPRARPGAVAAEINIILQILGTRLEYFDAFVCKTQGHLSRITEAQSTMLRIRDTPVPLPYLIILNIATALFVFSTPFLYQTGIEGRFLGTFLLVLSYYGILGIGKSIENPFAWDCFDISFEAFGEQLSRDTQATADAHRDDRAAFLKELVHPHDE